MKNLFTLLAILMLSLVSAQSTITKTDTTYIVKKVKYQKVIMLVGELSGNSATQKIGYRKLNEDNYPSLSGSFIYLNPNLLTQSVYSEDVFYDLELKKLPKTIIVWLYKDLEN